MFRKLIAAVALVGILLVGYVVYLYLKPTEAASAPIQAIPLTAATQTQSADAIAGSAATLIPTATEAAVATQEETTVVDPRATQAPAAVTQQPTAEAAAGPRLFEIDPAQSEARFLIDEVLEGSPKTVIGVTDQVSGQISVDTNTPANTQIGVIQVNARTLTTDNDFRNRAIKNRILNTNEYEFITFTPTAITGLPELVAVGQPMQFQISGDLTVRGETRPVIFDAQVTPNAESELAGTAVTTIRYADFGISIPQVPAVTGVSDEVRLEIDFVALAVQ